MDFSPIVLDFGSMVIVTPHLAGRATIWDYQDFFFHTLLNTLGVSKNDLHMLMKPQKNPSHARLTNKINRLKLNKA